MIKYKIDGVQTTVHRWKFPDSCVGIDIQVGSQEINLNQNEIIVTCVFGSEGFTINDEMFALDCAVDALKHQYPMSKLHLRLPYIPYARQDRAVSSGEAHQLKVIGKSINGMGFRTVEVLDPHSTVAAACIDRMYALDQYSVFAGIRQSYRETYIVAPDQGATKKCEEFAKRVGAAGVITCVKSRDFANNSRITGLRVIDDVPVGADLLVLDDLADAGGTFIRLAQELRKYNPSRLDLAVTHGLFTKGVGIVKDHFDKVFTTNSYISDKTGAIVVDCGF